MNLEATLNSEVPKPREWLPEILDHRGKDRFYNWTGEQPKEARKVSIPIRGVCCRHHECDKG